MNIKTVQYAVTSELYGFLRRGTARARSCGSPACVLVADALYAADRKMLATAPCGLCKAQVDALCDKDTAEAETDSYRGMRGTGDPGPSFAARQRLS